MTRLVGPSIIIGLKSIRFGFMIACKGEHKPKTNQNQKKCTKKTKPNEKPALAIVVSRKIECFVVGDINSFTLMCLYGVSNNKD